MNQNYFSPFSVTKITQSKKFSKNDNLFKNYIIEHIIKNQNKLFTLTDKNFKDILSFGSYDTIDDFLNKFIKKQYIFSIVDENLMSFEGIINILDSYIKSENNYKIIISNSFYNIFHEYNNELKAFKIDTLIKFSNVYTANLYSFLSLYIKDEKILISIENLKELMKIDKNKYDRFYDFEKLILKNCIKEIKKYAQLEVSYKKIKKDKSKTSKINGLLFEIKDLKIDIFNKNIENIKKLLNGKCNNFELIINFIKIQLEKKNYSDIIDNINYALLHKSKNLDSTIIKCIKYDLVNTNFKNNLNKYKLDYDIIFQKNFKINSLDSFRKTIINEIYNTNISQLSEIIYFLKNIFDLYQNSFNFNYGIQDNALYKALFIDLEKDNEFLYKDSNILILGEYNNNLNSNFAILIKRRA